VREFIKGHVFDIQMRQSSVIGNTASHKGRSILESQIFRAVVELQTLDEESVEPLRQLTTKWEEFEQGNLMVWNISDILPCPFCEYILRSSSRGQINLDIGAFILRYS
jgi:hypothetical protein